MINWGQKRIVGLDMDENACVACELAIKGKRVDLIRAAVVSDLKELSKEEMSVARDAIINLPSQVVLFRSFHLVTSLLKAKNKQKDIITFLSKQSLPFKLEECFWGNFILDGNFNFIAIKKEVAERYIAQAKGLGFRVLGVTASLAGLYNVLIYTYPERAKDRFVILNIKAASSDLLIYEAKRLWVYPLSIGKRDFADSEQGLERFSTEVHSIFNAHYMQNPRTIQNAPNYFYLSGQGSLKELAAHLKNVLSDFDIMPLDASKKINFPPKGVPENRQVLTLSLGLGLTFLKAPSCLRINLIEAKVKKEQLLALAGLAKKLSLLLLVLAAALLLSWNIILFRELREQASIDKNIQFQISRVLPDLKVLREEKEKLKKLKDYLENKTIKQGLYLKALAAISETRPPQVAIKEFNAQMKEMSLEVYLAGTSPTYQEINDFLSSLKKNKELKEVKVVASSFAGAEPESKEIDFKLRFDVTDVNVKPEPAALSLPKRAQKGPPVKEEKSNGDKR